ncbi:MAG: hypothetical protein DSY55_02590 [Clostridia bacterium]|nr:MAG: hypothetical protein DSY55_02590 [Clostridia bacterium]
MWAMNDYRSHLSVTTWIVLVSLVLGTVVVIPERIFAISVFNSPIAIKFSASVAAGALALVATWAGLEAALQTHPDYKTSGGHSYLFWGLPSAITLSGAAILPVITGQTVWLLTLGGVGAALAASMAAEWHTLNARASGYGHARLVLNVLAYAVAAIAFILIYLSHSRTLVSATLVSIASGLLSVDLLRSNQISTKAVLLYSLLIAFILAQFAMVLNYWPFASVRVALVLLVGFYLLVGYMQQLARRALGRRQVLEYLLMAAVAVMIVFYFPK